MGLLFLGTPLGWEEGQKYADYICEHGVTQLLNIWEKQKNRKDDPFLWGDEVYAERLPIADIFQMWTADEVFLRNAVTIELKGKGELSSVDIYLSEETDNRPEYNDVPVPVHEQVYQRLRDNNVDNLLAKHLAHLFVHDPLIVIPDKTEQDNEKSAENFETLKSTSWRSLRLKPPSVSGECGWRVEFRTMEVQPTDFRNAPMSVFLVLLSRAILNSGLNLYLPISKVDENMTRAQQRDAVRGEKFWFRKHVAPATRESLDGATHAAADGPHAVEDEYEEMTIDEIISGKGSDPVLIGVINAYIEFWDIDTTGKCKLRKYLELIRRWADGELPERSPLQSPFSFWFVGSLQTPATWIRNFIRSHPAYKHDSVMSRDVNYDLVKAHPF
ncbi:hypothetical protein FRC11_012591 [Ceratobasidium sp. 423]|nr:hypothetical protein FRC11_012591 [Ceratobasidium sp. 423]